ncbi:hypothetical protein B0H10DRAFT_1750096, partial [Mycena sp. CBHHK59/15]
VISEMLRLTMSGVMLPRDRMHDVAIGAQTVRCGTFFGYSLADVHLDAGIYAGPLRFGPGRYAAGRAEDKGSPLVYLGEG